MADLRQLGLDRTRARKGAVRPELTPSQIRGLLADVATGIGLPFIDAASQAAQGNYGQAAVSGLLDAPPVKMAGIALAPLIGMVRKAAPMDEALRIAQKNAAKPVSEGGLGLPPDNTPMDRARAMGYMDAYHGTNDVIEGQMTREMAGKKTANPTTGLGISVATNAPEASRYTKDFGSGGNPNVMPLMVRAGNVYDMPYKELNDLAMGLFTAPGKTNSERYKAAKKIAEKRGKELGGEGYDTVRAFAGTPHEELFVPDPSRIRSRFAAFDPARINENNLLASLAALGISVPVMRGLLQEEEMQ